MTVLESARKEIIEVSPYTTNVVSSNALTTLALVSELLSSRGYLPLEDYLGSVEVQLETYTAQLESCATQNFAFSYSQPANLSKIIINQKHGIKLTFRELQITIFLRENEQILLGHGVDELIPCSFQLIVDLFLQEAAKIKKAQIIEQDLKNSPLRENILEKDQSSRTLIFAAIAIAKNAHANQQDKAGEEYILHPFQVADSLETTEEIIVGLLHDVLEDAPEYEAEIKTTFDSEIYTTLKLLTKQPNDTYQEYIERIVVAQNIVAIRVKLADLKHNCDLSRLDTVGERDLARVQQKYQPALTKLKKAAIDYHTYEFTSQLNKSMTLSL